MSNSQDFFFFFKSILNLFFFFFRIPVTHVPLPQMFRHVGPEISSPGIQHSHGESQQPPRLQVPVVRVAVQLVGTRRHAVLLHCAFQPKHRPVLQSCCTHQFQMIKHQIRLLGCTRNTSYASRCSFKVSVIVYFV